VPICIAISIYAYNEAIQQNSSSVGGCGWLWDCVPLSVVVGAGCAGGGVPLGAVPALSWWGEVSLGGTHPTC